MSRAAVFALVLWCAGTAAAQAQVYRCGTDGRTYSQEPCEQGRAVDVGDRRTTQQAAQARQATLREARTAAELERTRLHAERLAAQQRAASIGPSRSVSADNARCVKGTECKRSGNRGEPSQRRPEKIHTVTLYRGAAASR